MATCEESRVQFEEWYKSKYLFQGYEFDRLENGCYQWVESMWQAWQASRSAIEISISKPKKGCLPGDYHIGYDSGAESQYESDVEAIRTAGLKIKGG